jgi:SAM-dependent methyltransferase
MSVARSIRNLWKLLQPTALVATRMRKDWDERARSNAKHYVATLKSDWTDEDFFQSGKEWIDLYVRPELDVIGKGRSLSSLRMLEIGCGTGRMTRGFSEMFKSVDAVDVSPEMIRRARSALSDRSNVACHMCNGSTLPMFSDATFDFAFSAIVFQHIPRKSIIRSYIREVSRVLRPGSVFRFQVEGAAVKERHADTWHGVGFSEEEMRDIATSCGFVVHRMSGAGTQYFWLTFIRQ